MGDLTKEEQDIGLMAFVKTLKVMCNAREFLQQENEEGYREMVRNAIGELLKDRDWCYSLLEVIDAGADALLASAPKDLANKPYNELLKDFDKVAQAHGMKALGLTGEQVEYVEKLLP